MTEAVQAQGGHGSHLELFGSNMVTCQFSGLDVRIIHSQGITIALQSLCAVARQIGTCRNKKGIKRMAMEGGGAFMISDIDPVAQKVFLLFTWLQWDSTHLRKVEVFLTSIPFDRMC